MEIKEIKSWGQFVSSSAKWSKDGQYGPNIYRGQANEFWELIPSLTRLLKDTGLDAETSLFCESAILTEFQNRYKNIDDHCKKLKLSDLLSWWEIMQHHLAPTRLLDWTKNPYAALYFSVSSQSEKNGALYIMDAAHLQWIQSLRAKDPKNKPNLNAFQQLNNSVAGFPYDKSMVIISSPNPTDRMKAQDSSFTLSTEILESHDVTSDDITFGQCVNRNETNPSILTKFIVPQALKNEFIKRLEKDGYSAETIYPDSRIIDEESHIFVKTVKAIVEKHTQI